MGDKYFDDSVAGIGYIVVLILLATISMVLFT
jgi:hypothetical protein